MGEQKKKKKKKETRWLLSQEVTEGRTELHSQGDIWERGWSSTGFIQKTRDAEEQREPYSHTAVSTKHQQLPQPVTGRCLQAAGRIHHFSRGQYRLLQTTHAWGTSSEHNCGPYWLTPQRRIGRENRRPPEVHGVLPFPHYITLSWFKSPRWSTNQCLLIRQVALGCSTCPPGPAPTLPLLWE